MFESVISTCHFKISSCSELFRRINLETKITLFAIGLLASGGALAGYFAGAGSFFIIPCLIISGVFMSTFIASVISFATPYIWGNHSPVSSRKVSEFDKELEKIKFPNPEVLENALKILGLREGEANHPIRFEQRSSELLRRLKITREKASPYLKPKADEFVKAVEGAYKTIRQHIIETTGSYDLTPPPSMWVID